MANRYFGINRGQVEEDVVEGASTNSTDIEVNVNLANVDNQRQVVAALKYIIGYMQRQTTKYPAH